MKRKKVVKIDGRYYQIRYQDSGFQHPEDKELWRANLVDWNSKTGHFDINNDDDWMLANDFSKVIARETGWDLRRYRPDEWGYQNVV